MTQEQAEAEPEPTPPPKTTTESSEEKKKKKTIPVELTEEEQGDLEEFVKHHPEMVNTPGEALKQMAGLKTYRMLKQKTDPERKKSSIVPEFYQDYGIPSIIPCAFKEMLDASGLSWDQFINQALMQIIKYGEERVLETKQE